MIPIYQESSDSLQINEIRSAHFPPHLHKSIELIYVTEGSLVMGVGIDLYELHKGDLGIVFPNLIHHYQVFSPGENRHIVLLASPSYPEPDPPLPGIFAGREPAHCAARVAVLLWILRADSDDVPSRASGHSGK